MIHSTSIEKSLVTAAEPTVAENCPSSSKGPLYLCHSKNNNILIATIINFDAVPTCVSDCDGVAVRAQLLEDRDEEEEMKKRKTSIIVHGLDEPAGVTMENRIENDKVVVEQLLHVIVQMRSLLIT